MITDKMLTHAELTRTVVPFRKNSDGSLYLETKRVLQKGTKVLLDGPFEHKNPKSGMTVRLIRFRTEYGPHEEMKSLTSGLFLYESSLSYTVLASAHT